MMKKVVVIVAVVVAMAAAAQANCGSCPGDKDAAKKCETACKAGGTVYACLACGTIAPEAGTCATCKAERKAMHVLAMKDGKISLCPCEAGCKCTVNADDATKCSCGKAAVTLAVPAACKAPAKPAEESAKPKDHPAH